MTSTTTKRFWKCYARLPAEVKEQAREAYGLFLKDPYYASLHFKRIHSTRPVFSVRISANYRAAGLVEGDEITWFWIGSHADYDKLLKRLRNA
ncbi:MAG: hypothetical protein NTW86_29170 [Candidatus Sumerlaeota bacterium]|nr:hypothetical protein [Candidatus Sumerlaeota bacterium]